MENFENFGHESAAQYCFYYKGKACVCMRLRIQRYVGAPIEPFIYKKNLNTKLPKNKENLFSST
jgi:hypothetical protein